MDWDGFPGWLFKRDFVVSPVSIHFPYSKVSRNRKTTKSLEKVIISRDFVISPVSRHFPVHGVEVISQFMEVISDMGRF